MSTLTFWLLSYCAVSIVAALVIYGACVISNRAGRIERGEAEDKQQPDDLLTSSLKPQPKAIFKL